MKEEHAGPGAAPLVARAEARDDELPHPLSARVLNDAIDHLARLDPDVARALERIGYPEPRQRVAGFSTLLRIMTAQQVSTRSAAALWARLEQACGRDVTAEAFLALDEPGLKAIGLSRQKMAYGRGLALAVAGGALDLERLATAPEDEAIAAIVTLHGFGRWSAEIYLLFALGRTDVFPADDLALQVAMQRLKGLAARPTRKAMDVLAEPWRPVRGCGAIFLWHLYGRATLDEAKAKRPA
ncbi:MAG: DNA-3-methyladenine glycosylase family protein, partial [Geminicoccaceae bacterium]